MNYYEWDVGYFKKNSQVRKKISKRTIEQKLVAWELDDKYYDGDRNCGYGGFSNDGRWVDLFAKIIAKFNLKDGQTIVDLGCKKGFILEAALGHFPNARICGIENHAYPLDCANENIKNNLFQGPYWEIPFGDAEVDFLIAFSSIYMQTLGDVVKTIREIQRVTSGNSYITLGAYATDEEKKLFQDWTLIGTTVLHLEEWKKVLEYSGYTGGVFFTTPAVLGLE